MEAPLMEVLLYSVKTSDSLDRAQQCSLTGGIRIFSCCMSYGKG